MPRVLSFDAKQCIKSLRAIYQVDIPNFLRFHAFLTGATQFLWKESLLHAEQKMAKSVQSGLFHCQVHE